MLRLTHPKQRGPAVKRIQEQLEACGYMVDTDGIFGPQTDRIVRQFQEEYHLKVDGIVGMTTRRMLRDILNGAWFKRVGSPGQILPTGSNEFPRLYYGQRKWDQIEGVVLHQTGCKMPRRPHGWRNLNAHIGVTSEGIVVIANRPEVKIWHAQKLSHTTIGIEIAGNFHGVEGRENTLWKGGGPAATLDQNQLEGCNAAMALVQKWFEDVGQEWKYIYAHRQSSKTRTGDPGSAIWQQVAIPWMEKTGATDGGEYFKTGTGKAIPKEWNKKYENNRYWG
jgi:N-acetyl-anhydromuramyl-L-alanine amidase AmpD